MFSDWPTMPRTPYDHANPPPPRILQLRGPENEVLWEGPPPLVGLTGIVGTVCAATRLDGSVLYHFTSWIAVREGETFSVLPATGGEVPVEVS
jgi:hypothetical protein